MKFILFFCMLAFSFSSSADVYFIDSISSTQSESKLLSELSQIIKDNFSKKDHTITEYASDADWRIEPTLILNKKMYTLSLVKKNSKSTVFEDSLKAKSKSELSKVAEELVSRALLFNSSVSNSAYDEQNKHMLYHFNEDTKSRFYAGLGFGGGDGIDEEDNQGFVFALGYLRMFNRYFGARANADLISLKSSDGHMSSITAGLQFYPLKRKHSPYLSTLVGYSWTKSGVIFTEESCDALCDETTNINESGLTAGAALGYQFFRNRPLHFGVELYYSKGFYDVFNQEPETFGGRVLIYWK